MRDIAEFDILVLPGISNSGPDHWQSHWEAAFPMMRRVEQDDWDLGRQLRVTLLEEQEKPTFLGDRALPPLFDEYVTMPARDRLRSDSL